MISSFLMGGRRFRRNGQGPHGTRRFMGTCQGGVSRARFAPECDGPARSRRQDGSVRTTYGTRSPFFGRQGSPWFSRFREAERVLALVIRAVRSKGADPKASREFFCRKEGKGEGRISRGRKVTSASIRSKNGRLVHPGCRSPSSTQDRAQGKGILVKVSVLKQRDGGGARVSRDPQLRRGTGGHSARSWRRRKRGRGPVRATRSIGYREGPRRKGHPRAQRGRSRRSNSMARSPRKTRACSRFLTRLPIVARRGPLAGPDGGRQGERVICSPGPRKERRGPNRKRDVANLVDEEKQAGGAWREEGFSRHDGGRAARVAVSGDDLLQFSSRSARPRPVASASGEAGMRSPKRGNDPSSARRGRGGPRSSSGPDDGAEPVRRPVPVEVAEAPALFPHWTEPPPAKLPLPSSPGDRGRRRSLGRWAALGGSTRFRSRGLRRLVRGRLRRGWVDPRWQRDPPASAALGRRTATRPDGRGVFFPRPRSAQRRRRGGFHDRVQPSAPRHRRPSDLGERREAVSLELPMALINGGRDPRRFRRSSSSRTGGGPPRLQARPRAHRRALQALSNWRKRLLLQATTRATI